MFKIYVFITEYKKTKEVIIMIKKLLTVAAAFIVSVMLVSPVKAQTLTGATALEPYTISFVGDSITYPPSYASVIAELPQINVKNYGVGASQVGGMNGESFFGRTFGVNFGSDLIVIFGGTNDYLCWKESTPLGAYDSVDVKTFCGAYNIMISNMQQANPGTKIVLMTPIRRSDEYVSNVYGLMLSDYVNAVKLVAQHNKLQCIDLYSNPTCNLVARGLLSDGVHPSIQGHQVLADEVLKSLVYMESVALGQPSLNVPISNFSAAVPAKTNSAVVVENNGGKSKASGMTAVQAANHKKLMKAKKANKKGIEKK